MVGEYSLLVVILSYGVAVFASFVVLEIAGKVMQDEIRAGWWITAGSLAMGTGIWSMHFVGMEAFELPIEVIYDLPLTLLSWVAAVAVSALALWTLSRLRGREHMYDFRVIIPAGILMGAGICIMHYSGMFAMRLSPGISYDPLLLLASFLIAAGASIVTLLIAVKLREVRNFADLSIRFGAALVMGVAIAGMHYTGMAAASFAPGSICLTTTGLEAGWTVGPLTVTTALILGLALFFSLRDTRIIQRLRTEEQRLVEQTRTRAFTDPDTGLRNRSWLNLQLSRVNRDGACLMSIVVLEPGPDENRRSQSDLPKWLKDQFPQAQAVMLARGVYGLLFEDITSGHAMRIVQGKLSDLEGFDPGNWKIGAACYPDDAASPLRLIPRARARAGLPSLARSMAA